jgi:hypothetical protein
MTPSSAAGRRRAALVLVPALAALTACTGGGAPPAASASTRPTRIVGPSWTATGPDTTTAATCVSATRRGHTLHLTVPAGAERRDEGSAPLAALRYVTGARTAALTTIAMYPWVDSVDDPDAVVAARLATYLDSAVGGGVRDLRGRPLRAAKLADGTVVQVLEVIQPEASGPQEPLRQETLWLVPVGIQRFGVGVYTRTGPQGDAVRRQLLDSIGTGPCPAG